MKAGGETADEAVWDEASWGFSMPQRFFQFTPSRNNMKCATIFS
jgi:hypothetical protein